MTADEIIHCIENIKRAKREDEVAPHKPMLLLLALKLHQDGIVDVPFSTVDAELGWLLKEFGGASSKPYPYLPFWHLGNDFDGRLWGVTLNDESRYRFSSHPRRPYESDLRRLGATGRLGQEVLDALHADPLLNARLVGVVLRAHISPPLHAPILEALGMDLGSRADQEAGSERRGSPLEFRRGVLLAYNSQCAICDFTVSMKSTYIALEAAHIRWRSWEGPDIVTNGIALCANHHRMFDRGVFTIEGPEAGYRVRVSADAQFPGGLDKARRLIEEMRFSPPLHAGNNPDPVFLEWHRDEVFERTMHRRGSSPSALPPG